MPAAHSPEFGRRALDLVDQGNPVSQTARDLGISESCLRNWMSRDEIDPGRKPGLTAEGRKELVELRRRLRGTRDGERDPGARVGVFRRGERAPSAFI